MAARADSVRSSVRYRTDDNRFFRYGSADAARPSHARGRTPFALKGSATLTATENRLLDALPSGIVDDIMPALHRERLRLRRTLYEPGERIRDLWFPIDAIISIVTVMEDGTHVEGFTVGREGVCGAMAILDGPVASQLTYCQVEGDAYRLPYAVFAQMIEKHEDLKGLIERYISAQIDVMAQSIACNRLHYVSERCARWILSTYDRVGREEFPLTHEVLAIMLGVRRAGVSIAAAQLQQQGAIRYARGRFMVADRDKLEQATCECYGAVNDAYAKRRLPPS